MKRLERTAIQSAILLALALTLITLKTPLCHAQQTEETTARLPAARPPAASVVLTVTVTDRRRNYVKGLVQSDFTVSDGKQEQQIKDFSASDEPLSVGVLLDASGSVSGGRLRDVRDALRGFFQLSHNSNEYFLIGFNNRPKLLHDWTSDVGGILKEIDAIRPVGITALFDACYLGVEKVVTGRHRKRALILISDGQDNNSHYKFKELRRLLEEADVLLYAIGILDGDAGSSLGLEGQAALDEFSSVTGGFASYPQSARQLNSAFDRLATELRNQYLIRIAPTAGDGKRHSLKVRVAPPVAAPREMQNLTVRSRKSFYAKARQR